SVAAPAGISSADESAAPQNEPTLASRDGAEQSKATRRIVVAPVTPEIRVEPDSTAETYVNCELAIASLQATDEAPVYKVAGEPEAASQGPTKVQPRNTPAPTAPPPDPAAAKREQQAKDYAERMRRV